MSEKNDAILLQLAHYFVLKHEYRFVPTQKSKDEIWLSNPNHQTYPVIRLSTNSLGSTFFDKERILNMFKTILGTIEGSMKLLDIHAIDEPVIEPDDDIIVISVSPTTVSTSNQPMADFTDIKDAIVPIEDPKKDYQELIKEINDAHLNKKPVRRKFDFKALPIVSVVFAALAFANFLLIQVLGYVYTDVYAASILLGAYYKTFVVAGFEVWRFLTVGFVHISIFHLLINTMALMNLGTITEKIYGKLRFTTILVVSIIIGSLFVFVGEGNSLTVGMSGGLYGLMGALFVNTFETGLIKQPNVRSQFIRILTVNIIISLMPGISLMGHLGGFVGGILLGVIFSRSDAWSMLRKNTIVATIALLLALGYLGINNTNFSPLYGATDQKVLEIADDLGLGFYADYMEERLVKFYFER
ncbi:MAG: rhomboid family intramembrane serine protease [Erysipelotrichaceae bacterium]|nr:rhomboid family intramembrane serine protease [Erysipelotrichaceae bacterium]